MKCILKFIISLSLVLFSLSGWGQGGRDTISTNGLRLGFDLGKVAYFFLTDNQHRGVEFSADVGYKKVVLVAEAGFSYIIEDQPLYNYTSNGLYGRLGVESNLLKGGDDVVFIGGRYGISQFSYQATNITIEDEFWGQYNGSFPKENFMAHWLEGVGGVKVNIFSNVFIGFTGRLKIRVAQSSDRELPPLYIPGFGRGAGRTVVGLSYYIFYRIPFIK